LKNISIFSKAIYVYENKRQAGKSGLPEPTNFMALARYCQANSCFLTNSGATIYLAFHLSGLYQKNRPT